MRANQFDEAAALLHTASRHAELPPEAGNRIRAALLEAQEAAVNAKALDAVGISPRARALAAEADEALKPFTGDQLERLNKAKFEDMPLLSGKGSAAASADELTVGGARRIDGADGKPLAVWKPIGRTGTAGILEEDGQIVAEILMSKLGQRLGLRVPHAQPLTVEGVPGVVIRWVPNSRSLAEFKPGARLALKSQVAKFKALHTLLGNYDVHMQNFKIDRAGRVWSIDAGQSILYTPPDPIPAGYRPLPGRNQMFNWSRHFRDWYANAGFESSGRLQSLATAAEMSESAQALRRLANRGEIGGLVEEAMENAPAAQQEMGKVIAALRERGQAMPELIDDLLRNRSRWAVATP